jgi:[protein-PII] uridylyltransferase
VVGIVYEACLAQYPSIPSLAIVATGGYGRSELSPYSDVDLTVIPSDDASPELDHAIRQLFQDLHTAFGEFGLEVGYAYRLIADAPGLDSKSRTGLLDTRLLDGNLELLHSLETALRESFDVGEFLLEKIGERNDAHRKFHATPLVVEPQLKEGAGGMRCWHCANWIRIAIGEQPAQPSAAYDEVVLFRNMLHLLAGKRQDTLSRTRQAEIADQIGADLYDLGSQLAESMLAVHQAYSHACERICEARFVLSTGVLAMRGEARLVGLPDPGRAAAGIVIASKLGLKVPDLPYPTAPIQSGAAALWAISNGEAAVRSLDRCGLLETLMPELAACRTLMPRDTVHKFTVFEHSLQLLKRLDSLNGDEFLSNLKNGLSDLSPLILACLYHDVGKIEPDQHHSELGESMAAALCDRWGLDAPVKAAVCFLIREHLSMARFIRMRDLSDRRAIQEFAALVKERDWLDMLALLTWADISSVTESAWTPALEHFLQELHEKVALVLEGDYVLEADPTTVRQRLVRQLRQQTIDESAVQEFVNSLPSHYLTSTAPDDVRLHMLMAEKARQGQPTVQFRHRPEVAQSEITVCGMDRRGLLHDLLGVIYAFDLSVAGIRACTTDDAIEGHLGVALDVFHVSFGGKCVPMATCQQVEKELVSVLCGEQTGDQVLVRRGKDPQREQELYSFTFVDGRPGIIEIRAPRGRGLPYRLARQISHQGWNILSARVGQWAGNAAAAFYVLGPQNQTIRSESVENALGPLVRK